MERLRLRFSSILKLDKQVNSESINFDLIIC